MGQAASSTIDAAFSIAKTLIEWPPTQLIILSWPSFFVGIKYTVTCLPHLLHLLLDLVDGKATLPAPRPPAKLKDDVSYDQLLPAAAHGAAVGGQLSQITSSTPRTSSGPPDAAFTGLAKVGYPFQPHYFTRHGFRGHYLDEPPANTRTWHSSQQGVAKPEALVLLHGNPTWTFMYRHMIPHLTVAGFRVIALDFIGFGRNDKLLEESCMTTELHASTVMALLVHLDLNNATLVMHDWSAMYMQWSLPVIPHDRIGRLVVLNTALPPHPLFIELSIANALLVAIWMASVAIIGGYVPVSIIMKVMNPSLPVSAALGYGTPFPSHKHKGALVRAPRLGATAIFNVDTMTTIRRWTLFRMLEAWLPGLSDVLDNSQRDMLRGQIARQWLKDHWSKPTLLLFGKPDPLFGSVHEVIARDVYNDKALAYRDKPIHVQGAGHYLPETAPEQAALEVIKFVLNT